MSIEDETGSANLALHPEVFERHRRAARHSDTVLVCGRVERKDEVVHVIVKRIGGITGTEILAKSRAFH